MASGLTRRLTKIERALDPKHGEVIMPVLDTPKARKRYGIRHRRPFVPAFRWTLDAAEARRMNAKRAVVVFLSKAEWAL